MKVFLWTAGALACATYYKTGHPCKLKPMETGNSPHLLSILSGILISAAAFIFLLSALAWFMPRFLEFNDTRYAKLVPLVGLFFAFAGGAIRTLRNRRSRS